jgi:putative membrane protein
MTRALTVHIFRGPVTTVRVLLLAIAAQPAYAHVDAQLTPHSLGTSWSTDWWLWLLIGLSGWLYRHGLGRLWRASAIDAGITRAQAIAFAAGWLVLVVALLSPLDALGGALFSAHMIQHELLMIVAAPLLVLGHPLGPWAWALPESWRKPAADVCLETGLRTAVRWLTRPLAASIVSVMVLWVWHIPALFNAALQNDGLHALQHASFFVSSLLFWWALFPRRTVRRHYGAAVFYVIAAGVQSSLLGALLTFARTPWYPPYLNTTTTWNLTALEDQQLGGLIMWIPGGLVYLAITLALMAAWMRAANSKTSSRGFVASHSPTSRTESRRGV